MSMSLCILGLRPPDEKWQKMKTAYDSCRAAGIPIHESVLQFFDYSEPDPRGLKVGLDDIAKPWKGEDSEGIEIAVAEIPKEITVIRFYGAW